MLKISFLSKMSSKCQPNVFYCGKNHKLRGSPGLDSHFKSFKKFQQSNTVSYNAKVFVMKIDQQMWRILSQPICISQKYSRLRCLLRVKGLESCFYLGWPGSILQFRQNIIKVSSKSWLLTCSSNITLSLPSYTGSALKRELNFCNGYLSPLYFCI